MGLRTKMAEAWPAFWTLHRAREEPAWARFLIANGLAFAGSLTLVTLAGMLRMRWTDPAWWGAVAVPVVAVGLTIGNTLLLMFRALELASTQAALDRLGAPDGWRPALFVHAFTGLGLVLGCVAGMALVSMLYDSAVWQNLARTEHRIHLALAVLTLIGANFLAWSFRVRMRAERRRANEARLHLLQAQIEPQFLFDTLGDVQDLLEHEPERARQMLEEFTDYLRASLAQLRSTTTTAALELDMARRYLQVLRHRMGERLRFSISASVQARLAVLPPGLLQPLLEHAIRHRLATQNDTCSMRLDADVLHNMLELSVCDNSSTASAAHERHTPALENLRARLQARFGHTATLTLRAHATGSCAVISLPFVATAVDPGQLN